MQAIELIIFWSVEIVGEQTEAVYDVSPKSANPGMQKPEEKGLKTRGFGPGAERLARSGQRKGCGMTDEG